MSLGPMVIHQPSACKAGHLFVMDYWTARQCFYATPEEQDWLQGSGFRVIPDVLFYT